MTDAKGWMWVGIVLVAGGAVAVVVVLSMVRFTGRRPADGFLGTSGTVLLTDGLGSAPLVPEPTEFGLSGDGTTVLDDIQWSQWGSRVAIATATDNTINGCNPACASAPGRLRFPGVVLHSQPHRQLPEAPRLQPSDHPVPGDPRAKA